MFGGNEFQSSDRTATSPQNSSVPSPERILSINNLERMPSYSCDLSSNSGGSCDFYAIKVVRKSLDNTKMMPGAINLAKEAKWLAVLSHKNVISLHYVGENPGSLEYFLVIDRLKNCLSDLITKWQQQNDSLISGGLPKLQVKQLEQRLVSKKLAFLFYRLEISPPKRVSYCNRNKFKMNLISKLYDYRFPWQHLVSRFETT